MKDINIAFIGAGIVATTLATALSEKGIRIAAIGARNPEKAKQKFSAVGLGVKITTLEEATINADLLFILVNDDAIYNVVEQISHSGFIKDGASLVHCSGALASSFLKPTPANYFVASAHPLQTFPSVQRATKSLPQCTWCCEGDADALAVVQPIIETISAKYIKINASSKALYHAGAVFACNYLTTLMNAALRCNELAGIDPRDAINALRPLIDATLDNIQASNPAQALTGPIARGDCRTVQHHLDALQAQPSLQSLYIELGRHTISLSKEKNMAPDTKLNAIDKLLGLDT